MQHAAGRPSRGHESSTHVDARSDVDVAALWASSGAQWLTAPGVDVPAELVRLIARITSELDAAGAHVAAAVGSSGLGLLGERAAAVGLPPSGSSSAGGSCRLFSTAAGPCAVSLARPSDVELVPAWLEIADVTNAAGDDATHGSTWAAVAESLVSADERQVRGLVERAGLLGLPVGLAGETARREHPVSAERLGAAYPLPMQGAVVVNLGSLWAAPLAGATLAAMGARVIKVESTSRPDGARRHRSFFASLHGACESVALDLDQRSGQARLTRLLERADVVIEGSRRRALQQMGIDARQLVRSGPQVWASITGHGRDPGHELRVGFGDDAAVAGGLVGRATPDSTPVFIADAIADPITGLTVAHAIVEHLAAGGRWLLDVALANVAAGVAGEWEPAQPMDTAARPQRRVVGSGGTRPLPLGRDTHAVVREFDLAE